MLLYYVLDLFFFSLWLNIDSKNTVEEESKQTPLQPVQLLRSRFQRYKPDLGGAVGKKELQMSENERGKKPEAEQLALQKDASANTVMVSLIRISALPSKVWFQVASSILQS